MASFSDVQNAFCFLAGAAIGSGVPCVAVGVGAGCAKSIWDSEDVGVEYSEDGTEEDITNDEKLQEKFDYLLRAIETD